MINNSLKTPSIFYVLPLLLNFQVIMNFVWKFFSKSKLCHGLNVNSLPCFPFLHSRHSSRSSKSLKYWKSHIKIYDNFFCPPRTSDQISSRLLFSRLANISYSLILRSQLPTPALAAWPTLPKCSAAKKKFLSSAQKQTWIIKRTLSI